MTEEKHFKPEKAGGREQVGYGHACADVKNIPKTAQRNTKPLRGANAARKSRRFNPGPKEGMPSGGKRRRERSYIWRDAPRVQTTSMYLKGPPDELLIVRSEVVKD